jgi:hypothetical protein
MVDGKQLKIYFSKHDYYLGYLLNTMFRKLHVFLKLHKSKSTNITQMSKSLSNVPCTYRLRPDRTMFPYVIIFVYVAVSSYNSRLELLVIHDCLLSLSHRLKEIPTAVKKFAKP